MDLLLYWPVVRGLTSVDLLYLLSTINYGLSSINKY